MIQQITTPLFVSLSPETRDKIREIFKVPRTSYAEVVTNPMGQATVVCDGTTNVDLQQLTVEKMRDFLGTAAINETIYDLFKKCVEKIETPVPEAIVQPVSTTTANIASPNDIKATINVNKCPDCAYTHASVKGLRMHILRKHLHK